MKKLLVAAITLAALATSLAPPVLAGDGPPRHDEFDRAREISALPFVQKVDLKDATQAEDDPSCQGAGHTVWYKFTPDTDIRLLAGARSRRTPVVVSAWTEENGVLVEAVDCDDYRPIVDATAGTTYYFMVGTYNNRRGGEVRFRLSEAPPPPTIEVTIDPSVTVNPQTEEVTFGGTITCDNAQYVEFYGSARQINEDRRFITAGFYEYDIDCDNTAQEWSVTELGDGVFVDGPGLIEVDAYAYSRFESVEFEAVVNVTIERP
jgi:hypothetical protein